MPSKKPKVQAYLEPDEASSFVQFCQDNNMTSSEAVNHLIRSLVIENDEPTEVKEIEGGYEGRLKVVEEWGVEYECRITNNLRKNEKLEEIIAELQEEVNRLKTTVKRIPSPHYTDDEIASVTGRRLQEVYEWRLGVRKPRGSRILEKLKPFEIVDGQWRKKSQS